jgi:alpha-1,2-mannosyltransferase
VIVFVVAVSMLLRAAAFALPGGLRGMQEYDDGVHYAASLQLLRGHPPYRDFVFLHPPGIAVLLLPFTAMGSAVGHDVGMAAARLAWLAVAGANTALVAVLARRAAHQLGSRRGTVAGLVAGLGYAVGTNAVLAAHTVMLEPLVTLFALLAAEWLLRPLSSTRGLLMVGFLMAASTWVKLWGVLLAAGAAVWVLAWLGRGPLGRFLTGYVAGIAVLFGPFVLLAPREAVRDLVQAQATRPPSGVVGVLPRLSNLLGWDGWRAAAGGLPLAGAAVLGVGLAAFLVAALLSRRPAATYWALQTGPLTLAFLLAGPYYPHYGEVVAAPLAILLGLTVARARSPVVPAAVGAAVLVGSGALGSTTSLRAQPDVAALVGRVVTPGACVYADDPSLAIAADRVPSGGCPLWVDPRGDALVSTRGHPNHDLYSTGFARLPEWQASVRAHLAAGRWALLLRAPDAHVEWDGATRSYLRASFLQRTVETGPWRIEVWQRRSGQ